MQTYAACSLPGVQAGRVVTARTKPGGSVITTDPAVLTTTSGAIPTFTTGDEQKYLYAAIAGFSTVLMRPTTAPADAATLVTPAAATPGPAGPPGPTGPAGTNGTAGAAGVAGVAGIGYTTSVAKHFANGVNPDTATPTQNRDAANAASLFIANIVGRGSVYVPKIYDVDNTVFKRTNVHFFADGIGLGGFRAADGSIDFQLMLNVDTTNGNNNMGLHNMTLDGNYQNRPLATGGNCLRILAADTAACNNIVIEKVECKNAPFGGMQLMNVTNVLVLDSPCKDTIRDGITIWFNSKNVRIRGCDMIDVRDDGVGLNCEGTGHTGTKIENVRVTDCLTNQAANSVNGNGFSNAGGINVTFTSCIVVYAQGWGFITWGGINSGATMPAIRTTITGCVVQKAGRAASSGGGIQIGANSVATSLLNNDIFDAWSIGISALAKCSIVGGSVNGGQTSTTVGIYAGAKFVSVIGVNIEKTPSFAIQVAAEKVNVSNNMLEECSTQNSSGTYIVIQASRATVCENTMQRITTTFGSQGIRIAGSPANIQDCIVKDNRTQGFVSTFGVSNGSGGTGNILTDNIGV